MTTRTSLDAITFSTAAVNAARKNGSADLLGHFKTVRIKADELGQCLQVLINMLPAGDPNIAALQSILATI